MFEFIVSCVVRIALLWLAFRLWKWGRHVKRASSTRWRRRMGALFFLAPILTWVLGLFLPEDLLAPLRFLVWLQAGVDQGLSTLLGWVQATLPSWGFKTIAPLCYAIVYTTAGVILGWPLDRLRERRAQRSSDKSSAT